MVAEFKGVSNAHQHRLKDGGRASVGWAWDVLIVLVGLGRTRSRGGEGRGGEGRVEKEAYG